MLHAAEDEKFRQLAETRNQADALVHATEKSLAELGEKVEPGERAEIESALADVKEALKGDSKETIEAKLKALSEASAGMAQKLYAEQQADAGAAGEADTGQPEADNIVDAEFEEVDDERKGA